MPTKLFLVPTRAIPLQWLFPTSGLLFLLLLWAFLWVRSPAGRFTLFALWARYNLDAYALYTVKPIFGSLSINALGSLAVLLVGIAVIGWRYFGLKLLMPVYLLLGIMTVSAVYNHIPASMVEQGTKFGYLIVMLIATYEALNEEGPEIISRGILVACTSPFAFLAISLALGISKSGERDGSVSWVGGYYHESIFSICVATTFIAICFTKLPSLVRFACSIVVVAGMLLANYRTTIIAMLPLIGFLAVAGPLARLRLNSRPLVLSLGTLVGGLALVGILLAGKVDLGPRVDSVVEFASHPLSLIRPTNTFTREDKSDASGRAYIWSMYIEQYRTGSPVQILIGRGPDSWQAIFGAYAQNTLISYLYEFGLFGALSVCLVWLLMALPAFRTPIEIRVKLLLLHAGFFILNMSTMPFWQVEGLIMYGVICGYTLYYRRTSRQMAAAPSLRMRPAFN